MPLVLKKDLNQFNKRVKNEEEKVLKSIEKFSMNTNLKNKNNADNNEENIFV